MDPYIPFCGIPPLPSDLWTRWTFEPALIAGLLVAAALGYRFAADRLRFGVAWGLVALLFISPLCAASMALFSARVGQHILLTLVAAPVLAAALPRLNVPAMPFAIVFALLFWAWHAPAPYEATLESDLTYWAMHLSLFTTATALFVALRAAPERAVLAAAFTGAHLTLYAMIVTLAPAPWHDWHVHTTAPFGLSALSDQQLAGALMWVSGGLLFLTVISRLAFSFLEKSDLSAREEKT